MKVKPHSRTRFSNRAAISSKAGDSISSKVQPAARSSSSARRKRSASRAMDFATSAVSSSVLLLASSSAVTARMSRRCSRSGTCWSPPRSNSSRSCSGERNFTAIRDLPSASKRLRKKYAWLRDAVTTAAGFLSRKVRLAILSSQWRTTFFHAASGEAPMCSDTRRECTSGSLRVCGIRQFSGCRFLREHAFISDPQRDTRAIQIFQERDDYAARGANFLSELTGSGGTVFGEELGDGLLHLFGSLAKNNDLPSDFNDLAFVD